MPRQYRRPAPAFQLYDQGSEDVKPRVVNLQSYLHRHTIVLVFYDGLRGPEADPLLVQLRDAHDEIRQRNIMVFGVSTALPQENRQNSAQPFPFKLLSDVTATSRDSVHRVWDRFIPPPSLDKPAGTDPAVFIIDRAGLVPWGTSHPLPDDSPETVLERLLEL